MEETYSEPVARLIEIGAPVDPWPDYPSLYGLTKENVPELIRMAVDESTWEEPEDSPGVYRNVHAYRALAQLGAVEAARPMTEIFRWIDQYDDDWSAEDLPVAFGLLGPAVIPVLAEYLQEEGHGEWARVAAVAALEEILDRHPEAQEAIVALMMRLLQNYQQNDEYFNASLVYRLSKLRLPETYPLVEEAFAADKVETALMGDWEDFQVEVGLLEKRVTAESYNNLFRDYDPIAEVKKEIKAVSNKAAKKEKNKRKQEKQSRKKNKKKK